MRRTRLALTWLTILAALPAPLRAQPAPPPVAPAGPKPLKDTLTGEAKSEYDAARLLYGNRDYLGAALKFQHAYDISKDPRLLFNVADCEIYLHHYARALKLIKRYLDEGGALVSAEQRTDASGVLENIQRFTTQVRIAVNEPGAEVEIDDEKLGPSPLAEPITLDIGVHKFRAHKEGFRDAATSMPLSGAGEVKVELKLEREVHEGKLTVRAPAGATITLDGRVVGTGHWSGTVASGGHALRVTAPGMIAYQSDVAVQDKENRSIDVALEAIPTSTTIVREGPREEEWRGALGGMEFGVRGAYGVWMHGDSPNMAPLWLDIGIRLGRPTVLAIYGQIGAVNPGGQCGTDVHGAASSGPFDLSPRTSFTRCSFWKAGLELLIHPIPRARFDPWFGFDGGIQVLSVDTKSYDPLAQSAISSASFPSITAGAQIGLDVHPVDSYRRFAVGPFAAYSLALFGKTLSRLDDKSDCSIQPSCFGVSTQNDGNKNLTAPFGMLVFGVRSAVTF